MEQNNNQNGNRSTSTSNKNLIIAAIAIIVVIAIAIAIPHLKRTTATTAAPVADATTDTTGTQSPDGSAVASLAAWNALYQKFDGRLAVFAADCSTTPKTQTQQKGNTILLMNNSNVAHAITIDGASYSVGAYHYKTVMLNTDGTDLINCDAHNSVASVTVQG